MYKDKEKLKQYRKDWYLKNKEFAIQKSKELKVRTRGWINEYKSKLKCSRCDENHIACLEFHHLDPLEKETSIGQAVSASWSIKRLLSEINKCIVLCANCHRKHHWDEKQ